MASITVYSFENEAGEEPGSFTTQDYAEAKRYAAEAKLLVVANEYEWAGSIPLEDFRPKPKFYVQTSDGYEWFDEEEFDSMEEAAAEADRIRQGIATGEEAATDVRVSKTSVEAEVFPDRPEESYFRVDR